VNSEFAYASFLSQVSSFYKSAEIDAWQAFLDDYMPAAYLDDYDDGFIDFLDQKWKRDRNWDSYYAEITISAATYFQKLAYCLEAGDQAQRAVLALSSIIGTLSGRVTYVGIIPTRRLTEIGQKR